MEVEVFRSLEAKGPFNGTEGGGLWEVQVTKPRVHSKGAMIWP